VRQVEQSSVSNAVSQNSDDVLRTARRGSDEVEGKGKEKLLDSVDGQDLGSGIQQDMGQSKPQITREESVRELMKRQGAVRLAKEKLGLAGNQDTGTVPKIPLKPKVSK
jgi:hypothetical protein